MEFNLTCKFLISQLPTKNGDLLPVMVWIYGGAFIEGSSNQYGGSYFMESDTPVVLVALNYRLGVLGFLNTGTASAPGNQGRSWLVRTANYYIVTTYYSK